MITSNIDLIKAQISSSNNSNITTNSNSFLSNLVNNSTTTSSTKTNSLSYENIKGITLEEIDTLFVNEDDKNMAKNLRLATLFSSDDYLSKALFNTVLGKPFNIGFSYLSSSYEDKNMFLSLPEKTGVFLGAGLAEIVSIHPIKVTPSQETRAIQSFDHEVQTIEKKDIIFEDLG